MKGQKTQAWLMPVVLGTSLTLSACATPLNAQLPVRQSAVAAVQAHSAAAIPAQQGPESPPVRLQIRRAEIAVTQETLNQQFKAILELSNEKRLREAVITTGDNALNMTGKVKAARFLPEVPFSVRGELTARPGNVIRFSPTDIRVVGIPLKRMMDIVGLELANLAKFKDRWGRVVQSGNDIDLIIEKFTSDAIIEGQIKEVRPDAEGITVFF